MTMRHLWKSAARKAARGPKASRLHFAQLEDRITPVVYFTDTFVNNAAGWTLGAEWQIGSATASSGHNYGGPDPATDNTPTGDNGVAGIVIGGNASTGLHGFNYLTSPVINTAGAPSLQLDFARWLNSDYTPYMQNSIDVFDGTSWQNIFLTGGSPGVQDSSWTPQSFNVTAYANANFQVRFGMQIGSSGVFTVSSWNVDDVVVQTATAAGPANDNFASATNLPSLQTTSATGSNVGATGEAGEPIHWNTPTNSVWWNWTAPISGPVEVNTQGSNYDTTLGVYTGGAVNALTTIGQNDDFYGLQSSVSFNAVAGTTYRIAVDGYVDAEGNISLNVLQANDSFARAFTLSGTGNGNNTGATSETGEPLTYPAASSPYNTQWWNWTAPSTGFAEFNTLGSGYDTTLGVYTGGAVNALTLVGSNDDFYGALSRVFVPVTGGTVYRVQFDGFSSDVGAYTVNAAMAPTPTTVYVSPTFTSFGTDVDGDLTAGGTQLATVGYNAFSTIGAGLAAVASGGTVIVNTASYAEAVTVSTPLTEFRAYPTVSVNSFNSTAGIGFSGTVAAAGAAGFSAPVTLLGASALSGSTVTIGSPVTGGANTFAATGTTSVTVNGTINTTGTTTLNAPTINLNANVVGPVTGTTATVVNVAAPGQIQDGLDVAKSGATVNVAAGTYSQVLTASKPVSLLGAGKASVTVTTPNPDPTDKGNDLLKVLANNVTVSGFTFDGKAGGGYARRAVTNVMKDGATVFTVSNLKVQNNAVQNLGGRGISLSNNGTAGTGNVISGNTIKTYDGALGVAESQGVYLGNEAFADITGNTITAPDGNYNAGVYAISFFTAGTMTWSGNTVNVGKTGAGLSVRDIDAPAGLAITGNTVNASAGVVAGDDAWGIDAYVVGSNAVSMTGNTVGVGGGVLNYGIIADAATMTVGANTTGNNNKVGLFASGNVTVNGGSYDAQDGGGTAVVAADVDLFENPLPSSTVTVNNANLLFSNFGAAVNGAKTSLTLNKTTVGAALVLTGTSAGKLTLTDTQLNGGAGNVNFAGAGSVFNVTANTAAADIVANEDAYNISGNGVQYNTSAGVAFSGLGTLNVYGKGGNDTFVAKPSTFAVYNIYGDSPANVFPGDTLVLNVVGVTAPNIPLPGLPDGTLTSLSHKAMSWVSIENLPVPLGLGGSFDFGTATSPLQPGFLKVLPGDTFAAGLDQNGNPFVAGQYAGAAGWDLPVLGFDRTDIGQTPAAPAYKNLLVDAAWGLDGDFGKRDFKVTVNNDAALGQDIQVTLIMGDTYFLRDSIEIYLEGKLYATLGSATGEFANFSVVLAKGTVSADNILDVVIRDAGGHSFWVLNELDVRPISLVNDLKLSPPIGKASAVPADGTTVTTYTGTGAQANGLVTISTTVGTPIGDVAPAIQGVQVQAGPDGKFSFQVVSPLSATDLIGANAGVISAFEVPGFAKSKTPLLQEYSKSTTTGVNARYDFDSTSVDTATGFTSVRGATLYTPQLGYGWASGQAEFERTTASVTALGVTAGQAKAFRDGVYNYGSAPGKFQLKVAPGTTGLNTRVYVGDSYTAWAGITVQAEGAGAPVPVTFTIAGQFAAVTLPTGSDANNDGVFWIEIGNPSGNIWVANGIDVAQGALPPLPLAAIQPAARPAGPVAPGLTAAQLAPIVSAAIDRWAATGIGTDQLAALRATTVTVGDLDAAGHLGQQTGRAITIDDDAGRVGWFVDGTPYDDREYAGGRGPAGVDLLTVVTHELGHVLGYIDLNPAVAPNDVMAESFGPGARRTPAAAAWVELVHAPADEQDGLAVYVG